MQVSTQSPWRPWCGSSPRRSSRAGRLPAVPHGHSWCHGEGRGASPRLHLSPTGCLAPGMWRCFSPGTGSPRRCLRLLSSGTASLRWNSSFCRLRLPFLTQRVGWRRGCQCAGWLWQWTRAPAATGGASRRSLFPRARLWTGSSLPEGIGRRTVVCVLEGLRDLMPDKRKERVLGFLLGFGEERDLSG